MCRLTSRPHEPQQQQAQCGRRQILEHYPHVMQPVNVFQQSIWRSETESDPIGAKRHRHIRTLARPQSKQVLLFDIRSIPLSSHVEHNRTINGSDSPSAPKVGLDGPVVKSSNEVDHMWLFLQASGGRCEVKRDKLDVLKELRKACEVGDAHALRLCLRSNPGISVFTLEVCISRFVWLPFKSMLI
jgi:hypothetical protein